MRLREIFAVQTYGPRGKRKKERKALAKFRLQLLNSFKFYLAVSRLYARLKDIRPKHVKDIYKSGRVQSQ